MPWTAAVSFGRPLFGPVAQRLMRKPSVTLAASPNRDMNSLRIAFRKRPADADRIDRVVNSMVRQLESSGETDIPTKTLGEMVMGHLLDLDQVAYVRYASVYRDFHEAADFNELVGTLRPGYRP